MEAQTRQERELATLESKIDFLVKNSDETKTDVKELVGRVAFQNGRVTSNEKAINDLSGAIEKLTEREEANSTWRKNVIYAGGVVIVLMGVLSPIFTKLAVQKAQSDVKIIVSQELDQALPRAINNLFETE